MREHRETVLFLYEFYQHRAYEMVYNKPMNAQEMICFKEGKYEE